jgi:hypothetical protein
MEDLAVLLRDHHENKVGPVHVETLDFLADVMDSVGVSQATILSAFRTPETNARLAASVFGAAEKSQHLLGRALDVTFDSRLPDARTAARKMGRGGVGWYPRSHFIHLDSGPPRNWEKDGTDLELMFAGHAPHRPFAVAQSHPTRPFTVAQNHPPQPVASAASEPHLPPCRETARGGVVIIRGRACAY